MENKRVSYSQYNIWATCPRWWEKMYVDGLKIKEASIDLVFGSAMHKTIQDWLVIHFSDQKKAKQIDLIVPFQENMFSSFEESIIIDENGTKVFPCDKKTFQEYFADGCEILSHVQKHAKDFFPTNGYELVGCEIPINFQISSGIQYVGFLDLVIQNIKNKHIHIIDFKTSKSGWFYQKKDFKKINQILLYKKFYSEMFNVPLDNIHPKFIILKRKISQNRLFEVLRISNFEPPHGKPSMKKAEDSWNKFIKESFDSDGNYIKGNKPTPSESNCKFCPFRERFDICPDSYYLTKREIV